MPGEVEDLPPPTTQSTPSRPDDPNLEYARQRTNLALRTLQEELAKEKSPLLERLGWTPADAQKFLREWEAMMKAAQEQGPRRKEAQRDLDKALQSLGLRARNTQSKSRGPKDEVQSQDPGRFGPPPEWADLFEAYNKSIGSGKP
jgi:deoxyribodipyrimidine photolyase